MASLVLPRKALSGSLVVDVGKLSFSVSGRKVRNMVDYSLTGKVVAWGAE